MVDEQLLEDTEVSGQHVVVVVFWLLLDDSNDLHHVLFSSLELVDIRWLVVHVWESITVGCFGFVVIVGRRERYDMRLVFHGRWFDCPIFGFSCGWEWSSFFTFSLFFAGWRGFLL